MLANFSPVKAVSFLSLGAATTLVSLLAAGSPAEAAATSGVRFQADANGLGSIMNPGGTGPFVSATTLQCPAGNCVVSNQLGTLFQSATSYSPFAFNYTADNLVSNPPAFSKDFAGQLGGFSIFSGVNQIATVSITGPIQGLFNGDFTTPPAFPNGELQNYTANTYTAPATIQVGSTIYSSAEVSFTAYSRFGWDANMNDVPLLSASNVWVYVDENATAVPSPLPIFGATVGFAWARKLRKTIRSAA